MKNYAIVLGVSEYACAQDLRVCANDAELMHGFLEATEKYEVLKLPGDVNKYQALEKIEAFLPINEEESEIGEVLFYFSGHGYQDHDMHFIMSDTTQSAINTTALNNSEIDDLVRKSKPQLFVKLIDACQSGMTYIKGIGSQSEDCEIPSAKGFENCIFLCSSKNTQASYAGTPYSQFTKAIIDAVIHLAPTVIKYTDIQNYLTDVFQREQNGQTPYFSTQCDGTEVFCEKNSSVLRFLKTLTNPAAETSSSEDDTKRARVASYLQMCREEEAVRDITDQVREIMSSKQLRKGWLEEFYEFSFDKGTSHIRSAYLEEQSLAKVLNQKLKSENLFVSVTCERVQVEESWYALAPRYQTQPVSFHPLARQLPCCLTYSLTAKNQGLPDYDIPFIFVYSPTFFYVFTCTKQYLKKGWNEYEETKSTKYTYRQFRYQDFTKETWSSALDSWLSESEEYIEKTILECIP